MNYDLIGKLSFLKSQTQCENGCSNEKKTDSMCLNSSMSMAIKFGYFPPLNYDSLIKTAGTAKHRKRNITCGREYSWKLISSPGILCNLQVNVLIG